MVLVAVVFVVGLLLFSSSCVAYLPNPSRGGGGDEKPVDYFYGTILDMDTQDPLQGMYVTVEPAYLSTFTGVAGNYVIDPVYNAYYILTVNSHTDTGYWDQKLYATLPTVRHDFWLPKSSYDKSYDILHVAHTPYASYSYPSGWSVDVTNGGYNYEPEYGSDWHNILSYTTERSEPYTGTAGNSLAVVSTLRTLGVGTWVEDTATRHFQIEEGWAVSRSSTSIVTSVQNSLSPTDPEVAGNLPFSDIWVERGRTVTGSIIESGSSLSDDGSINVIGAGAVGSYYRQTAPSTVLIQTDSHKEMRWSISVPSDDPDSYLDRGGHWFRVFYDGEYSYTPSFEDNIGVATGVAQCHIWCVDDLHASPGAYFVPPYWETPMVSVFAFEDTDDDLLSTTSLDVPPAAGYGTGNVVMHGRTYAWETGSATVKTTAGFEIMFVASSSTFTVACDWETTWLTSLYAFSSGSYTEGYMRIYANVYDVTTSDPVLKMSTCFEVYHQSVFGYEDPSGDAQDDNWGGGENGVVHTVQASVTGTAGHVYLIKTYVEAYVHSGAGILLGCAWGYNSLFDLGRHATLEQVEVTY